MTDSIRLWIDFDVGQSVVELHILFRDVSTTLYCDRSFLEMITSDRPYRHTRVSVNRMQNDGGLTRTERESRDKENRIERSDRRLTSPHRSTDDRLHSRNALLQSLHQHDSTRLGDGSETQTNRVRISHLRPGNHTTFDHLLGSYTVIRRFPDH